MESQPFPFLLQQIESEITKNRGEISLKSLSERLKTPGGPTFKELKRLLVETALASHDVMVWRSIVGGFIKFSMGAIDDPRNAWTRLVKPSSFPEGLADVRNANPKLEFTPEELETIENFKLFEGYAYPNRIAARAITSTLLYRVAASMGLLKGSFLLLNEVNKFD